MVVLYDEMPNEVRRPRYIRRGRIGFCPTCECNVAGSFVDGGIGRDDAFGRTVVHEDWVNRCPIDGAELGVPCVEKREEA